LFPIAPHFLWFGCVSPAPSRKANFCLRESSTLETYGLRWRIEVIFKAWKSQMDFHVIHRVSALELKICPTAKRDLAKLESAPAALELKICPTRHAAVV
jgi:hypothetical protein